MSIRRRLVYELQLASLSILGYIADRSAVWMGAPEQPDELTNTLHQRFVVVMGEQQRRVEPEDVN